MYEWQTKRLRWTWRVRVATARLKAVGFSMSCDFSLRVAAKGVRGAVASDEWLVARSAAENLWKERGGLICERNMGNGTTGVSKGKVFCREWLNFGTEWLFWRVQRQRSKVKARTLSVKSREESPLPKLGGRVPHPLQETKPQRVGHPRKKTKSKSSQRIKGRPPASALGHTSQEVLAIEE